MNPTSEHRPASGHTKVTSSIVRLGVDTRSQDVLQTHRMMIDPTKTNYRFRRMLPDDQAMIQRWLKTPAVREWWFGADGQLASIGEGDLNDPNVAMWIASYQGEEFAYIQDYDPHAWPGHHFSHLPPGSRGIDQFIGVPEMLDRGHGSAFIRAHVDLLFARGVPSVGTDPNPDNGRAIRCYEKAGFLPIEERMTQWGQCLLMERHAAQ